MQGLITRHCALEVEMHVGAVGRLGTFLFFWNKEAKIIIIIMLGESLPLASVNPCGRTLSLFTPKSEVVVQTM